MVEIHQGEKGILQGDTWGGVFKPNRIKEGVLAGNGQRIVLKSEHSKEDAQAGKGASVGVGKGGRGVEDLRTKCVLCFYGVTAPRPCLCP